MTEELIKGRPADEWIYLAGLNPEPSRTRKAAASPDRPDLSKETFEVPAGGIHPDIIDENSPDSYNLLRWGVWWPGDWHPVKNWSKSFQRPQTIDEVLKRKSFGEIARVISHKKDGKWAVGAENLDPMAIDDHLIACGYEWVPIDRYLREFGEGRGLHRVDLYVRPKRGSLAVVQPQKKPLTLDQVRRDLLSDAEELGMSPRALLDALIDLVDPAPAKAPSRRAASTRSRSPFPHGKK